MSGAIIGAQGYQRSGKTLMMYMLADYFSQAFNMKVYANIVVDDPNWIYINSLNDFPFNFEPKVLFLDELYNGADSNNWKFMSDISIFINTIGKQNVLFMYTTIDFDMVYNRIRNQTRYAFMVKADVRNIYYRIIDTTMMTQKDITIKKSAALFNKSKYDHEFVPLKFDWNMKLFNEKVIEYYKTNYPDLVKYLDS